MKKVLICSPGGAESERLKGMLKELGFAEILEAADLKKAAVMISDFLPDVLITEIDKQNDLWVDWLKELRGRFNLPSVLIGDSVSITGIERGVAAGAGGILLKPLRKEELWAAVEIAVMHSHEIDELKDRVANLEVTLEGRKSIERAKGLLMRIHNMSEPEAFGRMRKLAMDRRTTLVKVAEAILLTEGVIDPAALR